ncbi:MAG TPA: tetratricopeptide repeat protein, partial [Azospira sp.]|nr:tetratricopeptide repeat protein [Azospira sp.]
GEIDIGLDPFPYNGVTTTMEALWMGVPVLTVAGERFLARQGVGLLTPAGLADWIAADGDELIAKAMAHSSDLPGLAALRAGLRERLLASPLLDAPGFARDFSDALWTMWRKRCEQGPVGIDAPADSAPAAPVPTDTATPPPGYDHLLALFGRGDFAALESAAGDLLRRYPASGPVWKALGLAQDAQGKDSLPALTQAVALLPDDAEAAYNLGLALAARGRLADAEAAHRRALMLSPTSADGQVGLGSVLRRQGRLAEAEACFVSAAALQPAYAEAHYALGLVRSAQNRLDLAEASCRRAIALAPEHAEAWSCLAIVLQGQGRYAEAEAACREALLLRPGMAEARNNLGLIQTVEGRYEEAAASFREALAAKPDYLETFSNLLFAYNYSTRNSPDFCLAEAQRYGALAARLAGAPYSDWRCSEAPSPLRVGFVSGDLRDHSVGYFLEAMLGALAEEGIELIAYPTQPAESALTARIKPVFARWTPLYGLDDAAAAARIRDDGVHVLLDLSGHTAHNRLPVFARKPAPVQASWLGYCATTGLVEMDWYLADAWTLPEAQERYFTERIRRLPGNYVCFSPPADDVATNALPALAKGYVTFGSFNNLSKMTDDVVATWSRVLAAVPGSRLLLKSRQLADAAVADRVRARYAAHGIDGERLQLAGPVVERGGHLAAYRQVDIGLDPFPYNGVTTTMEALWMGVPVLSVAGERFLARQGLGLLSQAGLADWVAGDGEALVGLAVAKAGELAALAELRATLRGRLQAGPLLDRRGFAAHFADALRAMWRECPVASGRG